jgi:hypothetical protein
LAENVRRLLDQATQAGLSVALRAGRTRGWLAPDGAPSAHNYGRAADIWFVDRDRDWVRGSEADWAKLGAIGEGIGLIWGGRFKIPSPAHFEQPPGKLARVGGATVLVEFEFTELAARLPNAAGGGNHCSGCHGCAA